MARFKHRVLVEVTFDKRVTTKIAVRAVKDAIAYAELTSYHPDPDEPHVKTVKVKEAERVIQSEINWKNRRLPTDGRS